MVFRKEILIDIPSLSTVASDPDRVYLDSRGYLRFKITKALVHRSVFFERYPFESEKKQIHHINGNKTDNRIENLIALKGGFHRRLHKMYRMWELPNREKLEKMIELGRIPTKRKRNRASKTKKMLGFNALSHYGVNWMQGLPKKNPEPKPKKPFISKTILRKKP